MPTTPEVPLSRVFQSSHLHSATFTPSSTLPFTGSLTIRFGNGKSYINDPAAPVPIKIWQGLLAAQSPGQYFDQYIKPYWNGGELTQDG